MLMLIPALALVGALLFQVIPASGSSPPSPLALTVQGNGWLAAASDRTGNLEIWRMKSDGDEQVNLTNSPGSIDEQPAWSPDGKRIAFTTSRDGNLEVYVMGADGTGLKNLSNSPGSSDSEPAWSPDGKKIAFTSNRTGDLDVWIMNSDGSGQTNLTHDATSSDDQPAWSPLGSKIAFVSNRTGNQDIYTIRPSGTGRQDITNNPATDADPAWSPNAKKIAFTTDRDGDDEVYMMSSTGTTLFNLTNDPGSDSQPVWSPDQGTRVAFTSDRQGEPLIYMVNVFQPTGFTYGTVAVTHLGDSISDPSWQPLPPVQKISSPIQHVVVLLMENHSFDNVFGKMCVQEARCEGSTRGQLYDGTWIDLPAAQDVIPRTLHSYAVQVGAINGGLMNGWSQFPFCDQPSGYDCYQQFTPDQVPTHTDLAHNFAISDHTFELDTVGSWGGHTDLASTNLNGFYTATPKDGTIRQGPGWGCDGNDDSDWAPTPTDATTLYPTCMPKPDGSGPYKASPVPWVATIMDRMSDAGLTWGTYSPTQDQPGYGWAICPTFADCFYSGQKANMYPTGNFIQDAAAGQLRNLSLVMPQKVKSEHNGNSMIEGENWIADVVNTVMAGPQWNSTAIFLTMDDCGCFYDHVVPPQGLGIRVPMVIISPFAKPMYVDTNVASYASIHAFVESVFGLAPLNPDDAAAYDYSDSFNFAQKSIAPYALKSYPVPAWEKRWIKAHPDLDPDTFT